MTVQSKEALSLLEAAERECAASLTRFGLFRLYMHVNRCDVGANLIFAIDRPAIELAIEALAYIMAAECGSNIDECAARAEESIRSGGFAGVILRHNDQKRNEVLHDLRRPGAMPHGTTRDLLFKNWDVTRGNSAELMLNLYSMRTKAL